MRKLPGLVFFALLCVLFSACEGPTGPEGPIGPPGNDGIDGNNILGGVFELEGDFTANNEYAFGFTFPPEDIEVFESDVVLVYLLWEVGEDTNGDPLPIWRLIPQTIFLDNGSFQYNFDHTFLDVNIFLDGNYDFSALGEQWTQNQVFRVVILPADFADANARMNIDYSNYDEVISRFELDDKNIRRY